MAEGGKPVPPGDHLLHPADLTLGGGVGDRRRPGRQPGGPGPGRAGRPGAADRCGHGQGHCPELRRCALVGGSSRLHAGADGHSARLLAAIGGTPWSAGLAALWTAVALVGGCGGPRRNSYRPGGCGGPGEAGAGGGRHRADPGAHLQPGGWRSRRRAAPGLRPRRCPCAGQGAAAGAGAGRRGAPPPPGCRSEPGGVRLVGGSGAGGAAS